MRTYFDHEKLDVYQRIALMLTKLVERFDFSFSLVREEPDEQQFEDENEDEDES